MCKRAETLFHIIVVRETCEKGVVDPELCLDASGADPLGDSHRKLAYSAGTKHPHMAIMTSKPVCRRYVLLPENDDIDDTDKNLYVSPDILVARAQCRLHG